TAQQLSGFMNGNNRITKALASHLDEKCREHLPDGVSLVELLDTHQKLQRKEKEPYALGTGLADEYVMGKKKYDVFLSAAMAAISSEDYVKSRTEMLKIKRALKDNLNMSAYY